MARNSGTTATVQQSRGPGRPRKSDVNAGLMGGIGNEKAAISHAAKGPSGGKPKATASKGAPPPIKSKTGSTPAKTMSGGKGGKMSGGKGC